jgi:ATP-dependent DNA ligase
MLWQVGFDGNRLVIKLGQVGGAIRQISRKVEIKDKDLKEHALIEAKARFLKQRRNKDYLPIGEKPRNFIPTKGNRYYDNKKDKYYNIKKWPVATQAKLDGIRCYAVREGKDCVLYSGTNIKFPHLLHINKELNPLFDFFPEGTIFDGELYNPVLYKEEGFNGIQSIVSSRVNVKDNVTDIHYFIFDIYYPEAGPYNKRYEELMTAFTAYYKENKLSQHIYALTCTLAYSHKEIMEQLDAYCQYGYEGLMIRHLYYLERSDGPKEELLSSYLCKRCNNILKLKKFSDEEAIIIGFKEAEGTEEGAVVFRVQDSTGAKFDLRMKATLQKRREWMKKGDKMLGREVTFTFQGRSEKGIPRFPVGKCLREDD